MIQPGVVVQSRKGAHQMYKQLFDALTPPGAWNQRLWLAGLLLGVVIGVATILIASFLFFQPVSMPLALGLGAFGCVTGVSLIFSSYVGC